MSKQENQTLSDMPDQEKIAGFWKRIFAFLLDGLLIGILGLLLGTLFFDFFVEIGAWGRLIGFTISIFYFGIMNSAIGAGQTIGKRLLKIRVEQHNGEYLTLGKSFLRYAILGSFIFLNELPVSFTFLAPLFYALLSLAVFGIGGALIYLYVFNRKTRQSLHDIAVGSYVVKAEANPKGAFDEIWKGHLVVAGLILFMSLSLPLIAQQFVNNSELMQELLVVHEKMNELPDVRQSGIQVGSGFTASINTGQTTTTFVKVSLLMNRNLENYEEYANEVVKMVIENYPETLSKDRIIVVFSFGYDIGIATWSRGHTYNNSTQEWLIKLEKLKPGLVDA